MFFEDLDPGHQKTHKKTHKTQLFNHKKNKQKTTKCVVATNNPDPDHQKSKRFLNGPAPGTKSNGFSMIQIRSGKKKTIFVTDHPSGRAHLTLTGGSTKLFLFLWFCGFPPEIDKTGIILWFCDLVGSLKNV